MIFFKNKNNQIWAILIATVVVLTMELLRAFFVLILNNYGEKVGLLNAAPPTFIIFLAPFILPLIVKLLSYKRSLLLTVGGLAVIRFVAQLFPSPDTTLILSGLGTVFALLALSLTLILVRASSSDKQSAAYTYLGGVILGFALDTMIRALYLTWDPIWREGVVPLATATIIAGVTLFLLMKAMTGLPDTAREGSFGSTLSVVLIGPFFAFHLMFLHNVAFVASATGLTFSLAVSVVLIGDALSLLLMNWLAKNPVPQLVRFATGAAIIIIGVIIATASGIAAIVIILAGYLVTLTLTFPALSVGSQDNSAGGIRSISIALGIGSLLIVTPLIVYFAGQNISLPLKSDMMMPIAAVIFALGALSRTNTTTSNIESKFVYIPIASLIIAFAGIIVMYPVPTAETTSTSIYRVANYNIHYGINIEGWTDPESIAQIIESHNPDVVTLQEVSRGWLIGGAVDLGEWLSWRLKMPYVFAPAADQQFGNVVMSRFPIGDWNYEPLPVGDIPMKRSYMDVMIEGGTPLRVINTHVSAWVEAKDRLSQVQTLVDAWNQTGGTIITGDMNSTPGEEDINLFVDVGLINAQDEAGDPAAFTANSRNPTYRIDWIFGSPELIFTDTTIPQSQASDHFAVLTVVTIPD